VREGDRVFWMTAKKTKPKRKSLTVTCLLDLLERSTVQDFHSLGEEPIVFARELKSVIQGLLKELEKRIEELNEYEKMGFTKQFCANRRDEIRTYIIPLIKKTFRGVLDG